MPALGDTSSVCPKSPLGAAKDDINISAMEITIRDVARQAGVSPATAARALGDYGYVSAAARRSVVSAATCLGYRPNNAARTLASGSSDIVGLIVGDIENVFFAPVARGLADVVAGEGYTLLVANSDEEGERERRAVDSLRAHRVDGIVVAPARDVDGGHLAEASSAGTPVVLVDRVVAGLEVDSVVSDSYAGAASGVEHLLARGDTRIGIVIDNLNVPLSSMVSRLEGWRDAMLRAGVAPDDSLVSEGEASMSDGYAPTMRLLAQPSPPTAIFSASNLMTIGALRAIRELGIAMPRDLALVAFDDVPLLSVYDPPVTVVVQPARELGLTAGRMLMARLGGDMSKPKHVQLPTELVVRESSGAMVERRRARRRVSRLPADGKKATARSRPVS